MTRFAPSRRGEAPHARSRWRQIMRCWLSLTKRWIWETDYAEANNAQSGGAIFGLYLQENWNRKLKKGCWRRKLKKARWKRKLKKEAEKGKLKKKAEKEKPKQEAEIGSFATEKNCRFWPNQQRNAFMETVIIEPLSRWPFHSGECPETRFFIAIPQIYCLTYKFKFQLTCGDLKK